MNSNKDTSKIHTDMYALNRQTPINFIACTIILCKALFSRKEYSHRPRPEVHRVHGKMANL